MDSRGCWRVGLAGLWRKWEKLVSLDWKMSRRRSHFHYRVLGRVEVLARVWRLVNGR